MISFASLLIFLVIISVVAISNSKVTASFSKKLITEDVNQGVLASQVQHLAQASAMNLLLILNSQDRDIRVKLYKQMDEYNKELDEILSQLAMRDGQMVDNQLAKLVKLREVYSKEFLITVDFVEWDPESAVSHFNQKTHPALTNLLGTIQDYLSKQNIATLKSFGQLTLENNSSINLMYVLSISAIILGAALAFFVSRSIVLPIHSAVLAAKKMSKGDLCFDGSTTDYDEVGQLNRAFSVMSIELSALISNICNSAMQVEGSSTSLDTSVHAMSDVEKTQSAAVGSIADYVSRFSEQSTQAAQTTSKAKEQAESAKELASEGQQLIEKAARDFAVISNSISLSSDAVDTLKTRSVSVRALVTTVSEIADQTNLLALNAAIEAARAGESGRGFSVVADEVRNLALRTGNATQEINEVIDAIERETEISVQTMSSGRAELEAGIIIIGEMVKPLSELNLGAKVSAEQLALLETSVVEQACDSEKIDAQLQSIKAMSAENHESMQQVAGITENLGELSSSLKGNVSKFSLAQVH
jgi:methyl-accepting chemotaxis protein